MTPNTLLDDGPILFLDRQLTAQQEIIMKSLLLLSVLLAFLVMPTLAFAQCTQFTIHDLATGQMKVCTQCCFNGQCQVTCL